LKGSYNFEATKSGYAEKTWTTTVVAGQATSETMILTKASEGIPGYPMLSIALAVLAATIYFIITRINRTQKDKTIDNLTPLTR
jgi:hypothetical protein